MSKAEKENRIHSFALEFLERQQIVPNLYADQIIRGYKEGYHQAEKDNKLTWEDIVEIDKLLIDLGMMFPIKSTPDYYDEVLKRFKNLKN